MQDFCRLYKTQTKRYSLQKLPPYSYILGRSLHPYQKVKGHSYGQEPETAIYIAPEDYLKNPYYLYGVDLYNHFYWWESHEVWENLWHQTQKQSAYGQFLQALIQISGAFVKRIAKEKRGSLKLYSLGINRLKILALDHDVFMGLDLQEHILKVQTQFLQSLPNESEFFNDWLKNYPDLTINLKL